MIITDYDADDDNRAVFDWTIFFFAEWDEHKWDGNQKPVQSDQQWVQTWET